MKEKIENLLKQLQDCKEEFREWVKDKSIPLEERWDLFISSKLGDHEGYYEEFEGVSSDDYYDKYYINKHQTVDVGGLFNQASEPHYSTKECDLDTEEKKIAFKEDVLNKFIYSFEMDW